MKLLKTTLAAAVALAGMIAVSSFASAQDLPKAPAAGVSKKIDAIRASGKLRVGVQNNDPWLAQNTTGSGAPWSGPAWLLANTYAKLLGVQIQDCLLYTSPSPRDGLLSRMPSSA